MKCTIHISCAIWVILLVGSCAPQALIQTGEEAYQYRHYPQAIDMLTEEIERAKDDSERAVKSFWIAESYRLQNRYDEALPWYRKAYELEQNRISLESYAYALLRSQQYTNAEKLFIKLQRDFGRDERWTTAIRSAQQARSWIVDQDPNRYVIKRRSESSEGADFAVMDADDGFVVSSDRPASKGDTYHWTGEQHFDLFYTGSDASLQRLVDQINTPLNESNLALDPLGSTAVWTSCGTEESEADVQRCRLLTAVLTSAETWTEPVVLPFCDERYSYGHPTWSADGQYLIFSSDRPGGVGGHDLYITSLEADGQWTSPKNLGRQINTVGDEVFPNWHGDTLYFSSDGRVGMGGLDVYHCTIIDTTVTSTPTNMRPPVNSGGDDFGLLPLQQPSMGSDVIRRFVLSSNRKGSRRDDLYQFDEMRLDSDPIPDPPTPEPEATIIVEVYQRKRTGADVSLLPMADATVTQEGSEMALILTPEATASIQVTSSGAYTFAAEAKDHFSARKTVMVDRIDEMSEVTYLVKLILDPIDYGREIVLEDIYYDFDKWDIRADARPSLDSLAHLLKDNPRLRIELSSHTDCRGLDIYNTELSQLRAQSAVTYLTDAGIAAVRMTAVGYGERQPRIACDCENCTEEQHQSNRRTAFKVVR